MVCMALAAACLGLANEWQRVQWASKMFAWIGALCAALAVVEWTIELVICFVTVIWLIKGELK